jgi:MoxR-like ATPase
MTTFLVGVDGSAESMAALATAVRLGAELVERSGDPTTALIEVVGGLLIVPGSATLLEHDIDLLRE